MNRWIIAIAAVYLAGFSYEVILHIVQMSVDSCIAY